MQIVRIWCERSYNQYSIFENGDCVLKFAEILCMRKKIWFTVCHPMYIEYTCLKSICRNIQWHSLLYRQCSVFTLFFFLGLEKKLYGHESVIRCNKFNKVLSWSTISVHTSGSSFSTGMAFSGALEAAFCSSLFVSQKSSSSACSKIS